MNITITMDTEKETVEDLRQLQKAIDELIGKKLGAIHSEPEQKPTPEPLQTISPEPEPQVQSAGYPVQPESQPEVQANSPHELGEKVAEQNQAAAQPEQPRGWPSSNEQPKPVQQEQPVQQQQPKKTEGGCNIDNYEDLSGKLSDIFSKTKTN